MKHAPFILCMVCGKQVDRIEHYSEDFGETWQLRAHCHGAVDQMTVRAADLVNNPSLARQLNNATEGVAFGQKRITQ